MHDSMQGVDLVHSLKPFYLGMQDQGDPINMFDAQAWWARDAIMSNFALPDKAAMLADAKDRFAREDAGDDDDAIRCQADDERELIAETDYPDFDIDASNEDVFPWKKHNMEAIMGIRDHGSVSPMTGTMAPPHQTPWVEALDGSLGGQSSGKACLNRHRDQTS